MDITTKEIDPTKFRMGSDMDTEQLQYLIDRTPLGYYLTYGMAETAFQYGITQPEADETDEPYEEILPQFWDTFVKGIGAARGYGMIVFHIMKNAEGVPTLYYFDESDYTIQMSTDGFPQIESIDIRLHVYKTNVYSKTIPARNIGKDTYLFAYVTPEQPMQSKSYLEPVFDWVFIYTQIYSQLGVYAIRAASGLRKAKVRQSLMTAQDTEGKQLMTDVESSLKNWGQNLSVIIPMDEEGLPLVDLELDNPKATVDFDNLLLPILKAISLYTRIPYTALVGNELGMRSAETNQDYLYDTMKAVQEKARPLLTWILDRLGENTNYVVRKAQSMTEADTTAIHQAQATALQTMSNVMGKFGLAPEAVLDYLGIPLEADQSIIEENKAIAKAIGGGQNDPNGGTEETAASDNGGVSDGPQNTEKTGKE